ncbi:hypothetical protein BX616_003261 [Lobosporangium transversale]|uniref:BRCA1-associated protein 2-domain-containing protein n=1 Tax=Lobosporangium transversale TaxID=64571 RepID=A0A1Y2G682_9FUNG|nr:hypothetical protein BCR41DRAFT_343129 [Lobosporangium transversale]KAF9899129.1 hypothetical protein BX616_003261 [Lobosporangium transversale]ORY97085.1 hypothetical protein BCR41DRAFT_343129 [Lobosporangium transversale]|eukprot:XP_021875618.1 hypothetical protein BCR41DRAFT_343129 [Lobosporangium transversale]
MYYYHLKLDLYTDTNPLPEQNSSNSSNNTLESIQPPSQPKLRQQQQQQQQLHQHRPSEKQKQKQKQEQIQEQEQGQGKLTQPNIIAQAARFRDILKPFPQLKAKQQQQSDHIKKSVFEKTVSTISSSSSSSSSSADNNKNANSGGDDINSSVTLNRPLDYRFGPIRISYLDQSDSSTIPTATKEKTGTGTSPRNRVSKSNSKKMGASSSPSSLSAAAAASGGGKGTGARFQEIEPAQGILRLFKDTNEITTGQILIQSGADRQTENGEEEVAKESTSTSSAKTTATEESTTSSECDRDFEGAQIIHPDHGTCVCVLAVPSYMSPGDFLNFVGPVRADVSHFRIIRDLAPNRFMVLMKFRTRETTSQFYQRYNGKAFSSLEPEICHVVYLKSIEIRPMSMPPYAFPFLNDDPFLQNNHPTSPTSAATSTLLPSSSSSSEALTASLTTADITRSDLGSDIQTPSAAQDQTQYQTSSNSIDATGLTELPTCPVCLERMDSSVTGLLTILCQHTFHCHCLSKWNEGSCPVCRYSAKGIKKPAIGPTAGTDGVSEEQNVCAICGTSENLWICLVCGHIGCGRYQEKHAYHHYYETAHLYALELETQRVWDYAGDGYVHRLIQNKADGKLVELPSAAVVSVDGGIRSQHGGGGDGGRGGGDVGQEIGQEKLDAIGLEYTYLLTSQLESQRLYFDAQIAAMTTQLTQLDKEAKEWEKEAILLDQKNRELTMIAESLEKEKIPMLLKEKRAAEKRLEKLQEKLQILERQYEEEKEMNVGLRTNQESFKAKLQAKEAEIQELEEQVRDMMIYLDTQQKIEASPMKDELVNGTIEVATAPAPHNNSSSHGANGSSTSLSSANHSRRKGGRR